MNGADWDNFFFPAHVVIQIKHFDNIGKITEMIKGTKVSVRMRGKSGSPKLPFTAEHGIKTTACVFDL